jgi:hypothetical protein
MITLRAFQLGNDFDLLRKFGQDICAKPVGWFSLGEGKRKGDEFFETINNYIGTCWYYLFDSI